MHEKKKNLAWLIFVRLVVISLFLASITYFNIRQPDFFPDVMLRDVTRLIIVTYLFSILSLSALRFPLQIVNPLGYAQIVWEALFVSILVVITGGISSTYPFFFNLAIINASFLFGRREAFYTAGICGIIYGLIIDLHYFGKLESIGLLPPASSIYGPNFILSLIFANLIAFLLTAMLTGYLAERARKSETALKEKEIDYEELQRLNSIIVENLDSGLVTLNSNGRIRVFNRYISELTGVPQKNAYDMEFKEIFPELNLLDLSTHIYKRREIIYINTKSEQLILSLKYAPLFNNEGEEFGAVIDFIDMTEIRDMETKLKKSDRLAAIGELSARIAHEVRNPLASISGSVQLIAESTNIPPEDKKLIEIILRETSRLDTLVSEFLDYARPQSLQRSWFSLNLLIADLIALMKGDARFFSITIVLSFSSEIQLFADRDKFHQVLWNLLLNAAESMPDGGEISIVPSWGKSSVNEMLGAVRLLNLTIKDIGSGINDTDMSSIFEPFFTTKSGGSGLGLATVYRILEAHLGSIAVESSLGAGTMFTISIPVPSQGRS